MGLQAAQDAYPCGDAAAHLGPTAGLLAHTEFSKDGKHLQRYRQGRNLRSPLSGDLATDPRGLRIRRRLQPLVNARQDISRHELLHADATPLQMLGPGKGKMPRGYLCAQLCALLRVANTSYPRSANR
ncbi:IS66 family transposase [Paraburkholderia sp. CNPSo 3076]|uniref:IS66 family transposase n=1 Tax=Paraburkholderia sp. CNPSo 3076 TaxID=2940936 RepID=UPI003A520C94